LFDDFETGRISIAGFREAIRSAARLNLSDSLIDECWNSILEGMPPDALELIRKAGERYRIFLLSNTNALHETGFRKMLERQYGAGLPESLFEKVYLSHRMGMRKPDAGIFRFVLEDSGLDAEETVFIDDSPQHVEGARSIGITAWWLQEPMTTGSLLKQKGLL
jgi:putative hydrolase of the HAD superfamily